MRIRSVLTAALATALALALAPVGADEPTDTPPTVTDLGASVEDDVLRVAGTLDWGAQAPVLVGEDFGEDPPGGEAGRAFGTDLKEVYIHQPDANVDELVFIWQLAELNAPPPHEVVRYLWQMRVGGEVYWLQAKTSDLSTSTMALDDPEGHLTNLNGSFRLRGDCGALADGAPVNTCRHVAWLDGVFDTEANQVRMTVPLDLDIAPHFTAGSPIDNENQGAEAGFQAGISNANTTKSVAMEWVYTIPFKQWSLSLWDDEDTFVHGFASDWNGNPDVLGELDVSHLAPGDYTVKLIACFVGCYWIDSVGVTL